jgi:hypothetical protein
MLIAAHNAPHKKMDRSGNLDCSLDFMWQSVSWVKRLAPLLSVVPLVALAAMAGTGCTASTTDSGATCAPDDTVPCSGASGFSCSGNDSPDEDDPSLSCSVGVLDSDGNIDYCCLSGVTFVSSSCSPDAAVADCQPGSYGFSCSDPSEAPEDSDSSLTCSTGVDEGNGLIAYCCTN